MKRLLPLICASVLIFSNSFAGDKEAVTAPDASAPAAPTAPPPSSAALPVPSTTTAPFAPLVLPSDIASEIIEMRSNLAKTFIKPDSEITEETFKGVCGAVGKRVKEIMEKEGVIIRHATTKQRNPMNAATPEEAELISRFYSDRKLGEVWDETTMDGKAYMRYTRPVYAEEACLACHGAKDKRPRFITEKYPEDRAYGFKAGDLRAIISVLTSKGQ